MAAAVECQALSPWEDPGKLQGEPVSVVLLFHRDFDETRDAEVWLEIRENEATVRLREKEPRLRRALILALATEAD